MLGRNGLPDGVFNLVQGGRENRRGPGGADIDGLLFTGSAAAGAFRRLLWTGPCHPGAELGGNNP